MLSRLRGNFEERLDEPDAPPRWARPMGWAIALVIVALIIAMTLTANPL